MDLRCCSYNKHLCTLQQSKQLVTEMVVTLKDFSSNLLSCDKRVATTV